MELRNLFALFVVTCLIVSTTCGCASNKNTNSAITPKENQKQDTNIENIGKTDVETATQILETEDSGQKTETGETSEQDSTLQAKAREHFDAMITDMVNNMDIIVLHYGVLPGKTSIAKDAFAKEVKKYDLDLPEFTYVNIAYKYVDQKDFSNHIYLAPSEITIEGYNTEFWGLLTNGTGYYTKSVPLTIDGESYRTQCYAIPEEFTLDDITVSYALNVDIDWTDAETGVTISVQEHIPNITAINLADCRKCQIREYCEETPGSEVLINGNYILNLTGNNVLQETVSGSEVKDRFCRILSFSYSLSDMSGTPLDQTIKKIQLIDNKSTDAYCKVTGSDDLLSLTIKIYPDEHLDENYELENTYLVENDASVWSNLYKDMKLRLTFHDDTYIDFDVQPVTVEEISNYKLMTAE